MAGVLAALFGVLSGIVLLVALLNLWLWHRDRRRRVSFWLGLFTLVQLGILLCGAVVIERPASSLYADALLLRSSLLGVSAVLAVITLGRLIPGLRIAVIVIGLTVMVVVHSTLWATTDLLVHHPVISNQWPTYGPGSWTGLIYGASVLYVVARAIRRSDRIVRRILCFTMVWTLANDAVTAFVRQGLFFDASVTLSVVPASAGILCLGARTISRTATARDVLMRRQATLAELGRVALPAPGGDWVRVQAEAVLSEEFGREAILRIDSLPAADHDRDAVTSSEVRTVGRSCVVTATVAGIGNTADRRFVESVVQLVAAAADRSSAEADIAYGATHDQLTGLPNRVLLADRLAGLLGDEGVGPTVLVLCRLHGLDTLVAAEGHDAGDSATVAVAHALALLTDARGFLARQSTDVFALVDQLAPDEDLSTGLGRRLEALTATLRATSTGPAVRASIGAVVSTDRSTAEGLLRDAAAALGRATPGGPPEIFDVELGARARAQAQLIDDLSRAVARREIEVHYQPIVDINTRAVSSYEALARWRRHGELLPPAEWIPIAEQCGLIDSIGLHVLELACQDQRRLGLPVAVNVSALQVTDEQFVEQVVRRLGDCPPDRLVLEVTESVVLPDVHTAVRVFEELRGLGIRAALDDFGTSYSSLSVLAALPVDILKIDRVFVQSLSETSGPSVVTSIVSLAHALGKSTVAEGVETERQLAALADLGVDRIQGYLTGRPVAVDSLVASH